MILRTENIHNNITNSEELTQELSLEFLIPYLQERIAKTDLFERSFPKIILDRIYELQETVGELSLDNLDKYEEIFHFLYYLSSNALIQDEITWAIGYPVPDKVFYGQQSFYSILDSDFELIDESLNTPFYQDFDFSNKILYLLILEKLYHLPPVTIKQLFRLVDNEVNKYYNLKIDYTFMEVSASSPELPVLDLSCLYDKEISSFADLIPFLAPIDLKSFCFKGFTLLKFIDKTHEQAGVKIQNLISRLPSLDVLTDVSSFNRNLIWDELKDIIKTLANSSEVQCSFFPLLELNGVPILTSDLSKESIFFSGFLNIESSNCNHEISSFLNAPYTITFGFDENTNGTDVSFVHYLKSLNIASYVCFPLRNKNNLVGFLEVYAYDDNVLKKSDLLNIASYLSLMSNLAQDIVSTFKTTMDKVILEKYTSLQEAVQWKFNQEAANYLGQVSSQGAAVEISKISFTNVFPIYGAIDVRNSTKLRNMAFRNDSYKRLAVLQLLVDQLESKELTAVSQMFIARLNNVKSWLDEGKIDQYLMDVLSFFQDEVFIFFETLDSDDLILSQYKKQYLRENEDLNSDFNSSSKYFDHSLSLLNSIIDSELGKFNDYVQQLFPSYFEKFRTDGIEYDLYIGQSITPTQDFDINILKEIRKQQIVSMIVIAKETFSILEELPISLVTTQLIFVHPNPIDISFRQDERRFDVEGGYNIRYEVIKKRIDKARILDTQERLVQPNKIAIVYSSPRVKEELLDTLESLVNEQLIRPDIEHVILEELQGVQGLQAFRIAVAV